MAVLIPIKDPLMFRRGPPLFPGLIDASTWIKSLYTLFLPILIFLFKALIIPVVTVWRKPNGFPMARTCSPIIKSSERPIAIKGKNWSESILIIARSDFISAPITRALNSRLSPKATRISDARATTCSLVIIYPSLFIRTPEPRLFLLF